MFSKQKHFLNFSEQEIDKTLKLYGRNRESFQQDVDSIRNWMKTQPHFPNYEMTDFEIGNFILATKCRIEKTKLQLDNYFTCRHLLPEVFDLIHPQRPAMVDFRKKCIVALSLNLTESCQRIFFCKALANGAVAPNFVVQAMVNLAELRFRHDLRVGEIVVMDLENVTISDILQFNLKWLKIALWVYQNVYSIRLEAFYIINSISAVDYVLAILKTLLKPKLFGRIHCDQGFTSLLKNFKKDQIPRDYGGDAPSLQELQLNTEKGLALDLFDKLNDLKTNEDLRPEPLKNDELLGFYGNFKKLDVD